jgi:hypothetical protein
MCRSIKPLFNFEPPATDDEIRAAALQYVRKIGGFVSPSKANAGAFDAAVDEISRVSRDYLNALTTQAPARSREEEAVRAKARSARRFGAANESGRVGG